jgi:putative addiction module component (TIGR02574 family)
MASPPAAALPLPDVDDDEEADADHDEAWEAELDRRIAEVREGRVETIAWEDVQAKIEAMLGPRPGRVAVR